MLFSSIEFIFLFLPITLALYFSAMRYSTTLGHLLLVLCSLFFYGYWNPNYLPLILGSIVFNYLFGMKLAMSKSMPMLTLGVCANLGLLAYFKYANFLIDNINVLTDSDLQIAPILLPLAISFFTFQQIAYLVDSYRGETRSYGPINYALFVCFFPQLIAGPIVHHRQVTPQFAKGARFNAGNITIGTAIFTIGLVKKVFIADNLADYANPVFAASDQDVQLTFFEAWGGALAYTCQLYFDFSGYADMAIGAARMFNIKLPINFNSPYKSANIIEFWRRWHITLSTFLRDYLYIPLGGNRNGQLQRYQNLFITMLLGGLWHGAGWNFLIWGGLHGLYLSVNHLWQASQFYKRSVTMTNHGLYRISAILLTFTLVTIAWVFFRASNFDSAMNMLSSMAGVHGAALPNQFFSLSPYLASIISFSGHTLGTFGSPAGLAWIAFALSIAFFLPNSQQIMQKFEPALDAGRSLASSRGLMINAFDVKTGILFGVLLALALSQLSGNDEFLYFNF